MSQSPIAADDAALRSDVRRLGDLLGQTLVRQEGPELLALVEEVRKAVREGSGAEILAQLSVEDSVQLVRAFSTYFHLANVAEQVHRARVLADARATGGSWLARAVDRIEVALKAQTPGHELSKEEIEKMKKEAEMNADSDRKAKEEADVVNQADSLIFQTEKQLGEFGEKLSEDNKTAINLALIELKMAYEAKDVAAITPALQKINTAWTNASAEMYNTGDAQGAAQAEPQASGDTTQDVEFEEVK